MKIFLSYASEDRGRAEEIQLALAGAGHEVFFDRESLPAGGDYNTRIRASIDDCDGVVFLISPDSIDHGGYALTELGYARARWAHPKGRVLPVLIRATPFDAIPPYLKSVTILEPTGNTAAEVVDAVARLAPRPAAWKWPAIAAVVLLAGITAAYFGLRATPAIQASATGGARPAVAVPNPVQLRFSYRRASEGAVSLDDTLRVNLQTARHIVDGERLAQQPAGYYSYNTAYPGSDEKVYGTLIREIRESSLAAAPAPARFCLKRPAPLPQDQEQYVHLDCAESGSCTLHFPSPKWLETCPPDAVKTSAVGFSLISPVHAAPNERRWSVPSASTLAAHKEQLSGVGYTLFSIETDALRDPAVIGVEIDIRVNGVPIYEDGVAPALRPAANDPSKPFTHTFALESLDFVGAQAGCEAIVLTLRPRLAGGQAGGEPLRATLPYVALRDAPRESMPFGKGTLTWSARYVVPPDEWSHEAFITSVTYAMGGGDTAAADARNRVEALKQAFDALHLSYRQRPMVGVIRPPLTLNGNVLAYGLTAGVVQPSGQVRFTFSNAEAEAIAQELLSARTALPAAQRVINRDKYVYKAAGNPQRQSTPTPPGVCRHVKA